MSWTNRARVTIDLDRSAVQVPRTRPAADMETVSRAAAVLQRAGRPAIVAGSGVHLSGASGALAALADLSGIPVATTVSGKGSVPDGSPWSLGVAGANGARPYANAFLAEADAVLFVGTRANATDTNSFRSPLRAGGCTILQIDIDPVRAGRNFPNSIRLVGDARTVLRQLASTLPEANPDRREDLLSRVAAERRAWEVATGKSQSKGELDHGGPDPRDVVRTLMATAGPDALIVADCGTPTPNLASFWETATAGRRIIIPRGHGPMGYAIPGAIGAARAAPDQSVLAITTDGSFAMACGELETVARLGLPVVFVQLTNHSLGWIKMLQHLYLGKRYFGVDPGPIDSVGVAEACGLRGAHARTLSELAELVRSALEQKQPTYLELEVPDEITLPPPVAPWQAALAGNESERPVY